MDEQSINKSILDEMVKVLSQRRANQGDTINMLNVIEEASYSIAVNVILAQKRIKEESNGKMLFVHPDLIDSIYLGMKNAIITIFPGAFKDYYLEQIKANYLDLMSQENVEKKINAHYRSLFNDLSLTVL